VPLEGVNVHEVYVENLFLHGWGKLHTIADPHILLWGSGTDVNQAPLYMRIVRSRPSCNCARVVATLDTSNSFFLRVTRLFQAPNQSSTMMIGRKMT
jgi:hypothetical protein